MDLGQTGWMTVEELDRHSVSLGLKTGFHVLEVGCGAGGGSVYLAETADVEVTGIDANERGIQNARLLAESSLTSSRLHFSCLDAGERLPFPDETFDAVFANDCMCHIPNRGDVLKDWYRVLQPNGRMLFTDAMVVTGILSDEELAIRTSIGNYYFLPPGCNEDLIRSAGFPSVSAVNVTEPVERISRRWHDARSRRSSQELTQLEGEQNYLGLQRFLSCVSDVSRTGRLSRFEYTAVKTG